MINFMITTKTLEKNSQKPKKPICRFLEPINNYKLLKGICNWENEVQTRFTNLHIRRFFHKKNFVLLQEL